ncbi:MAG: hypothetical protein L0H96_09505 [Humibacillus sp.]|nr:hypothetical protein [Humibacillus sp.]MDN5777134.1 hypothetical protein [Humibacillus sp.]
MTTTTRLTAAAAALAVLTATAACRDDLDPPPPQTSQTSTTPSTGPSSTTPGTSSTSSTPAPTSLTPAEQTEAKETAAAEAAYRAWVKNYAAAEAAGFDPKKLDRQLATPALIDYVTGQFKKFRTKGGAGKYTQDIRWMKSSQYLQGITVQFQICAVTNSRFLQDGKDVTITSDGTPAPVRTEPLLRYVSVESIDDGKTWKSSTILYSSDEKKSC